MVVLRQPGKPPLCLYLIITHYSVLLQLLTYTDMSNGGQEFFVSIYYLDTNFVVVII